MGTTSQVEAPGTQATESPSFSVRQKLSLWLITWAGYLLIRGIGPTLRFRVIREPHCLSDGRGATEGIWCFWHRCLIPAGYRFRGKQLAVMIGVIAGQGEDERSKRRMRIRLACSDFAGCRRPA